MRKSKLAIASFVLSLMPIVIPIFFILGLLIFAEPAQRANATIRKALAVFGYSLLYGGLLSTILLLIPSIVLGIIALIKIKGDNIQGRGFAIAGIVISVIIIIVIVLLNFSITGIRA